MGKDLGTYHLRVELEDGRGWIERWDTGPRHDYGTQSLAGGGQGMARLNATRKPPLWDEEEDLVETMLYAHTEGNSSCDCNKARFLARAYQQAEPEDPPCGNTMRLKRLTVIRPDASEFVIRSDMQFVSKDTESNKQPCPFCGISLLEVMLRCDHDHAATNYFLVKCYRCGCEGPLEENEEDAIEHWNHRVVNRKE